MEPTCPYSATRLYLGFLGDPKRERWPLPVLTTDLTERGVRRALRDGPYGRCVYACDNDVADHQAVTIGFDGGVTAALTMSAFTPADRSGGAPGRRGCPLRVTLSIVVDIRPCEQCGTWFAPRREHARFCSARCRVAWNRQNASDRPAEASALGWSIIAMRDATDRLLRRRVSGDPQAFAMISEAVWWVTIVDATLVRYHPDDYNGVLAGQAAERQRIEGTLAGLRFVRNRMGYYADPADFIQPRARGAGSITAWTWKPLPEPALASLPPRGQEWEMGRYRAYQEQLRGHTMGATFGRAAAFLRLAAAAAGQ